MENQINQTNYLNINTNLKLHKHVKSNSHNFQHISSVKSNKSSSKACFTNTSTVNNFNISQHSPEIKTTLVNTNINFQIQHYDMIAKQDSYEHPKVKTKKSKVSFPKKTESTQILSNLTNMYAGNIILFPEIKISKPIKKKVKIKVSTGFKKDSKEGNDLKTKEKEGKKDKKLVFNSKIESESNLSSSESGTLALAKKQKAGEIVSRGVNEKSSKNNCINIINKAPHQKQESSNHVDQIQKQSKKKDKKLKASSKSKPQLVEPTNNQNYHSNSSNSIDYSSKLCNFNLNFDQLVKTIKTKKSFLNIFEEKSNKSSSSSGKNAQRKLKLDSPKEKSRDFTFLNSPNQNHKKKNPTIIEESVLNRNEDQLIALREDLKSKIKNKGMTFGFKAGVGVEGAISNKYDYSSFSRFYTPQLYKNISLLPSKEHSFPELKVILKDSVLYDIYSERKKLLVINLVDTMIRIRHEYYNDSVVEEVFAELETVYTVESNNSTLQILFRPGLIPFLNKVKLYYHIIMLTSSSKSTAEPIIKLIDPKKNIFTETLYRDHCNKVTIQDKQYYIKDLRVLTEIDSYIGKCVIVDDDVLSFGFNLDNGIPCTKFTEDTNDDDLVVLSELLIELFSVEDVRTVISHKRKNAFAEKLESISKMVDLI